MNLNCIQNVMNNNYYNDLINEINWETDVTHLGGPLPRLFALQATITEIVNKDIIIETVPLYRHPMDKYIKELQFTPTVEKIRLQLEEKLNCKLNHAIIQCYRSGEDYISEHADKTLDVAKDSIIVNYTAGETRILKLRSKDKNEKGDYDIFNVLLENDSAFILDMETNLKYKHSIRKNANIINPRISITFRNIHTYYTRDKEGNILSIFGKGYGEKNPLSKDELYESWSKENNSSQYTWKDLYSRGYDKIGCFNL